MWVKRSTICNLGLGVEVIEIIWNRSAVTRALNETGKFRDRRMRDEKASNIFTVFTFLSASCLQK
jgi:hypothetical protein